MCCKKRKTCIWFLKFNNTSFSCSPHSCVCFLQEEHTLYSLSGGAVTPESHLDESTSPADTTEDNLPSLRPWGRSQSLPAYADLIMVNGNDDGEYTLLNMNDNFQV